MEFYSIEQVHIKTMKHIEALCNINKIILYKYVSFLTKTFCNNIGAKIEIKQKDHCHGGVSGRALACGACESC